MKFQWLSIVVACSCLLAKAATVQLPKVHAAVSTGALEQEGKWWAKVGDHIVHTPREESGLSSNVEDYYYLYGSHGALTQELKEKRVGGAGRLHIIHLPDGEDALKQELPTKTGRRAAVSNLVQLSHQKVLSDAKLFPDYSLSEGYTSNLSQAGQALEDQVVANIGRDALMAKLKELTELGDDTDMTRSYTNAFASANAIKYIEDEFKDMGYETCRQQLRDGQISIVAHLKGSDQGQAGSVSLGGHYDSRPFQGAAPGAVDNGSGAAAVLAIARAMADAQFTPKRSVFFVAFAAEEPGLWGSEEFASRLVSADHGTGKSSFLKKSADLDSMMSSVLCGSEGDASLLLQENRGKKGSRTQKQKKHEALIMDEIAWKSGDGYVVNLESFDWASHVLDALAGASKTHNGDGLRVTHSGNPFGSDHMSFLEKGYQAVLSIHGDDEAYPNYHTSNDKMDQVNAELYTMIVKMNAGALVRLAGIDA